MLAAIAILATSLAIVAWEYAHAPVGFEDDDGFHFGRERDQ